MDLDDILSSEVPGTAHIKSIDEDKIVIEGYGVVFGGKDLTGKDSFTKSTDYMLDLVPRKLALYDHTKQASVDDPIGFVNELKTDDTGIWVSMQLDRHHRYATAIAALAKSGVLGISSGAISHLVRKDSNGNIKRWPLVEFSLTPTPAEPRTLDYLRLKEFATKSAEFAEILEELKVKFPETAEDQADGASKTPPDEVKTIDQVTKKGTSTMDTPEVMIKAERPESVVDAVKAFMSDWKVKSVDEPLKTVEDKMTSLSTQVDRILAFMQDQPAIKRAGYFTEVGGTADASTKSFGDFLLAVKRKDFGRLDKIYHATKDLSADAGGSGGYLIPQEY